VRRVGRKVEKGGPAKRGASASYSRRRLHFFPPRLADAAAAAAIARTVSMSGMTHMRTLSDTLTSKHAHRGRAPGPPDTWTGQEA